MMKWFVPALLVGSGLAILAGQGAERPAPPPPLADAPLTLDEATGTEGDCVGSCAFAHDAPPELTAERYRALLERYAAEPTRESAALEELLFHHTAARRLLASEGLGDLDAERADLLREELARDHAWLDVRVVDAQGVERIRLEPTRVPMDHKQHLFPEQRVEIQELEVSGTVRRVGLDHLWTRL